MKFRTVAIKLTAFALFTGAVTLLLAASIGNFSFFKARYRVVAEFNDATGLLNNDIVTIAGVTVGKVTGLRVEKGIAVVDISVDRAIKLPRTTRVEIRYRNLIGLRVVNIDPGDGAPPYLRDGERIPTTQTEGPLDLDNVFNNLKPLLSGISGADINTLSKALVVSFAGHKDDIDAVLADTATFFNAIAGKGDELGSLVDNVAAVAGDVADERAQLERLLSSFASVAETLAGDSSALDRVLVNLNTATGELAKLIADNRGSLERDLDDLATVLNLVLEHQADLKQVANHLDDQLAGTLRAMSFGEWANLYVPAFCIFPICEPATASAAAPSAGSGVGSLLSAATRTGP